LAVSGVINDDDIFCLTALLAHFINFGLKHTVNWQSCAELTIAVYVITLYVAVISLIFGVNTNQ